MIRKVLDISMDHLPEALSQELLEANSDGWMNGPVIIHPTADGFFMWVPSDPQESALGCEEPVPEILLRVQLYARSQDCDYVLFDREAEAIAELPTFPEAGQGLNETTSYTRNAGSCVGGEGE